MQGPRDTTTSSSIRTCQRRRLRYSIGIAATSLSKLLSNEQVISHKLPDIQKCSTAPRITSNVNPVADRRCSIGQAPHHGMLPSQIPLGLLQPLALPGPSPTATHADSQTRARHSQSGFGARARGCGNHTAAIPVFKSGSNFNSKFLFICLSCQLLVPTSN